MSYLSNILHCWVCSFTQEDSGKKRCKSLFCTFNDDSQVTFNEVEQRDGFKELLGTGPVAKQVPQFSK
jgi:hypothetical protein